MPNPNPIERARSQLVLGHPFFAALALRLKVAENPAIETCSVDGVTLSYNPTWVDDLPFAQLVGVTAHEVMHCALGHHIRRGGRDMKRWNKACDYAVNPLILEAGLQLPPDALIDSAFAGMSAEQIYRQLSDDEQQGGGGGQGQQSGQGDQDGEGEPQPGAGDTGGCGGVEDMPGEHGEASEAEREDAKREWEIATLQAANLAKAAGNLPGLAKRLAADIKKPKVDWREATRNFITTTAKLDYSWTRPNRRHIAGGLYLPSLHSDRVGDLVLAIDVSGSIDQEMLAQFVAELNAAVEEVQPERVHVVYCDTGIQGHETFESDEFPIRVEAPGGGGTAFSPVWDWIEEQGIEPAGVIYYTDLDCYGNRFGDDPGYPVLWASTEKEYAPFGEVVRLPV